MDHLLTPLNDLQEIPQGNVNFSLFTDGSYLKGDNGKYRINYAITTLSGVVEAASAPMATSVQQTELFTLTGAYTLSQGQNCQYL